jgi:DNA (cytosine-5)-methyltransferase 1
MASWTLRTVTRIHAVQCTHERHHADGRDLADPKSNKACPGGPAGRCAGPRGDNVGTDAVQRRGRDRDPGRVGLITIEQSRHRTCVSTTLCAVRAAEFFAGIGLTRLGLEPAGFDVVWSNDWEPTKHAMYEGHFGTGHEHTYVVGDIEKVSGANMPDLDFAWASFPCTDLSLAGWRKGLAGDASGTFYAWARILREMGDRMPRVVAAENVVGLATSHGGDDLRVAVKTLNGLGYSVDVLTLDARRFVPQSRPRMFLVGSLDPVIETTQPNPWLRPEWLSFIFDDEDLVTHQAELPDPPKPMSTGFTKTADKVAPGDEQWWDSNRVAAFIKSLSPLQSARLNKLIAKKATSYRTAYRRTRNGVALWEIRADDIAGCLRTARGGSSKQAVVRAGNGKVMVRWMTPHEYAVLMGAPDYRLDGLRATQVMFGCGDAVVVPVIEWLATHYLAPLVSGEMAPADLGSIAAAS